MLIALLGAQLIAGLVWLGLDDASPPPWDEAVYLNNGVGYCTNEVAGNPFEYLRTSTFYPPGVPWSSCLLYALLGTNPDAVRLTGLVFLLGVMVGAYLLGARLSGNRWTGLMAAFLVGTYPIVFGEARFFLGDVPTTFWVTAVLVLLVVRSRMTPLWWGTLLGASLGAGLLTQVRFPVYVGAPLAVVFARIAFLAVRDSGRDRRWGAAAGLSMAVALGMAAIWYGVVLGRLLPQLRAAVNVGTVEGDPPILSWGSLVWYPFSFVNHQVGLLAAAVFLAVALGLLRYSRPGPGQMRCLEWWASGPRLLILSLISSIFILTLISNKDPRFAMPLLVPIAVITALALAEAFRRGPRLRRAGVSLAAISIANGVFLFATVSFAGFPSTPTNLPIGERHLVLAASSYHLARPPEDRLVCDQRDLVSALSEIVERRPRVGLLLDSNFWNHFNLRHWSELDAQAHDLVQIGPDADLNTYDALVFAGTWGSRLPPPYYTAAGSCTGYDESRVSFYVSAASEERVTLDWDLGPGNLGPGAWSGSHATLTRDWGKVASASIAGPNIWAETSWVFSTPTNLTDEPGVRVQWRLSRNDADAFWVFLEDVQGRKLVWDQTAATKLGGSPIFEDLRWSDASTPDGFDLGAVRRLAFSVLEPDPAVHPSLTADVTRIPPQR
ncbi:MAG: glycosyltransferase family 39 protein [Chloroflexi bacterium]|nr:glycosyltransferase family 39 protein [Chloroflexota bacterium]